MVDPTCPAPQTITLMAPSSSEYSWPQDHVGRIRRGVCEDREAICMVIVPAGGPPLMGEASLIPPSGGVRPRSCRSDPCHVVLPSAKVRFGYLTRMRSSSGSWRVLSWEPPRHFHFYYYFLSSFFTYIVNPIVSDRARCDAVTSADPSFACARIRASGERFHDDGRRARSVERDGPVKAERRSRGRALCRPVADRTMDLATVGRRIEKRSGGAFVFTLSVVLRQKGRSAGAGRVIL